MLVTAASIVAIAVVVVLVAQAQLNRPQPTEAPEWTLTIVEDGFSDLAYEWPVDSDAISSVGYIDDRYRILVKRPDYHVFSFVSGFGSRQAISVEADAIVPGNIGEPGVLCVADAASPELYVFAFHGSPGAQGPHIITYREESWTVVATGAVSDAISATGPNRIRGDCIGGGSGQPTELILYVNGSELLRYEDPHGFEGFDGIGLWAHAVDGGTEVLFDDAVMKGF